MEEPIVIKSDDPIIKTLNFKPFRNKVQRGVIPFSPADTEPQTRDITTPWGAVLTAKKGDMLVYELDRPNDVWPVNSKIFDESYIIINPGICVKRAVTLLVPLLDITGGDPDRTVDVHTMEGVTSVRAGDFYLAKGVEGEIWPYPIEKANEIMSPAE
ncbi:MAG: hypothetical protein U0Z26_03645 [Anaerolineales bacterium]